MTLNANFAGAALMPERGRLEGTDRGLDAVVGLVIVIAELLIGSIAILAMYISGVDYVLATPAASDAVEIGFGIALIGSSFSIGITTLVYAVRVALSKRSWRAPLWGALLMTAFLVLGYLIMANGG